MVSWGLNLCCTSPPMLCGCCRQMCVPLCLLQGKPHRVCCVLRPSRIPSNYRHLVLTQGLACGPAAKRHSSRPPRQALSPGTANGCVHAAYLATAKCRAGLQGNNSQALVSYAHTVASTKCAEIYSTVGK